MDKAAIKTYAVGARRKLIEAVKLKARQLYIFEDSAKTLRPGDEGERLRADGIFLTHAQLKARERLYGELLYEDMPYKPAIYNRVMENVACTWFNRLIALRIMEVNDWLPSNIRILSSREQGRIEPDAIREVERLDYVSQAKIVELQMDKDINAAEKLYKYILISQCNALSAILPGMFQKENDYTELLLPDALLSKGGIVNDLVTSIDEENFDVEKQGQIEIIGWLYQFYISEKKDEVFADLKKNIKLNKDTIPAATQLFTPEWIVKYMVENSLGRLWLDNHPNQELRVCWKYYIDEAEQEPEVAEQLRILRSQSPVKRPEDVKLLDPCMGSGHILVYAFEVLLQIYQSEGYSEREIPNLILQNNLYGLDIDDRAGQLAYFALMIKARSYNRRFFRQESIPQPMVYTADGDFELSEYGSLLKVDNIGVKPVLPDELTTENINDVASYMRKILGWQYRQLLMQKYDVVITNPPYMGSGGMNKNLTEYVKKRYPVSKNDTLAIFIEKCGHLCKPAGYVAMITTISWLTISSYAQLRGMLLKEKSIYQMIYIGYNTFPELNSKVAQGTTFIYRNIYLKKYISRFIDLHKDLPMSYDKNKAFINQHNERIHDMLNEDFCEISGTPLSNILTKNDFYCFKTYKNVGSYYDVILGLKTGDNEKYLRNWYEIDYTKFTNKCFSRSEASLSKKKWFPYSKGGDFRKWYGNLDLCVNWEHDGLALRSQFNAGLSGIERYFNPGITWTGLSNEKTGFREHISNGSIFDTNKGPMIFKRHHSLYYLLGYLNTKVAERWLFALNSSLSIQTGDVKRVPIFIDNELEQKVEKIVTENVSISQYDWDSFETSWDYKRHPLILNKQSNALWGDPTNDDFKQNGSIQLSYTVWESICEVRFETLKANEEELNRIFIDIYGLHEELTPEVENKDVTICKADLARDIRSLVSYAVGCMFGRYSLDELGLVFAGGKFDISRYKTFLPEDDNIIPIGSTDYFDDDIVVRFIDFIRMVYGNDTLGENLNFIADAIYPNGNGTAQERIRRYFLSDFFKDHVKIYQKRPIYWLFDSGKKDGFKALIYLHRYDKYTVARVRTDYLHPLQRKYEAEIKRLELLSGSSDNPREKAAWRKETDILQGKIDECRTYDQVVSHIAHQQIELDLDDGVKVNYAKFQGVEVPKDNGKSETMDLLARI